jgi:hypothetical protein
LDFSVFLTEGTTLFNPFSFIFFFFFFLFCFFNRRHDLLLLDYLRFAYFLGSAIFYVFIILNLLSFNI